MSLAMLREGKRPVTMGCYEEVSFLTPISLEEELWSYLNWMPCWRAGRLGLTS